MSVGNSADSGGIVWIKMLRTVSWLEAAGARPGQSIRLDQHEMGAVSEAEVLKLSPCPEIEEGSGMVVTATFRHQADENSRDLNLLLEGQEQSTDNHPLLVSRPPGICLCCDIRIQADCNLTGIARHFPHNGTRHFIIDP